MTATATVESLTKDLHLSKSKVDQLAQQLEKEKAHGRTLYTQFEALQADMQTAFGIEPSKTARKRKGRASAAAPLKSAATALLAKLQKEGKTAQSAKATVLETLLAQAKKELGLSALPKSVTRHVDKHVGKLFKTTKQ
jgi:hypothetical protein